MTESELRVQAELKAWEADSVYRIFTSSFIVLGPLESLYEGVVNLVKPVPARRSLLDDPRPESERTADHAAIKEQRMTAGYLAVATTAAGAYYFRDRKWIMWALIFCTVGGLWALAKEKDLAPGFTASISF